MSGTFLLGVYLCRYWIYIDKINYVYSSCLQRKGRSEFKTDKLQYVIRIYIAFLSLTTLN